MQALEAQQHLKLKTGRKRKGNPFRDWRENIHWLSFYSANVYWDIGTGSFSDSHLSY